AVVAQCLPATAGLGYTISGKMLVPAGQSATGIAQIAVNWTSDANCSVSVGPPVGPLQAPLVGSWTTVNAIATAPAGTQHAYFLLSMQATSPGTFVANFDDLSFVPDFIAVTSIPTLDGWAMAGL